MRLDTLICSTTGRSYRWIQGFDAVTVAGFQPPDIDRLAKDTRIVRNSEGGAPERSSTWPGPTMGPDVTFPPMPTPLPGYVTHITVERIGGIGPWTEA